MKSTDEKAPKLPVFQARFSELAEKYPNKTKFAQALGIGQQTVSYWLNGERVPDAAYLIRIAEKTGVSIDWLLGISDSSTPDLEIKAICDYTGLSDKAINVLHEKDFFQPCETEYENDYADLVMETLDRILCTKIGHELLFEIEAYMGVTDKTPLYTTNINDEKETVFYPQDIFYFNGITKQRLSKSFIENAIYDRIKQLLKLIKAEALNIPPWDIALKMDGDSDA